MAGLDLESAVVGPNVDRDAYASDAAFVDLDVLRQPCPRMANLVLISPSPQPPVRRSRTRGLHISSSNQRREGIVRGIGRRYLESLRWLVGRNFGSGLLLVTRRRARVSPSSRILRVVRSVLPFHVSSVHALQSCAADFSPLGRSAFATPDRRSS